MPQATASGGINGDQQQAPLLGAKKVVVPVSSAGSHAHGDLDDHDHCDDHDHDDHAHGPVAMNASAAQPAEQKEKAKKSGGGHGHSHGGGSGGHGHSHGPPAPAAAAAAASSRSAASSAIAVSEPDHVSAAWRRSERDSKCAGVHKANEDAQKAAAAANKRARNKLICASLFCLCFMIAEVIGGLMANSLAILTDAAHLLSDLAGFLISIFALWLASIEPTSTLSFGFHRAEILGALMSVVLIWLMTGVLIYEAINRIRHPPDVDGKIMFIVACAGLGVNILMGFILHQSGHSHSHGLGGGGGDHGHSHGPPAEKPKAIKAKAKPERKDAAHEDDHSHGHGNGNGNGHGHAHDEERGLIADTRGGYGAVEDSEASHHDEPAANINVTSAFIHVIGDAVQSIGVMIAAGLIWHNPKWSIADPICTFVFSILVIFTTVRLVKQSVGVLMEGVPEGIEPEEVRRAIKAAPGVVEVHDLHIWSLSVGKPSLSAHVFVSEGAQDVLETVTDVCASFNIHHTTIQVERAADGVACNPHAQYREE